MSVVLWAVGAIAGGYAAIAGTMAIRQRQLLFATSATVPDPATAGVAEMQAVTLTAAAGSIYFLEHTVVGDPDDGGVQSTSLRQISDQAGRRLVSRSQLLR